MTDFPKAAETYPHLTNEAAFVDKAVLEVWGTKRKRGIDRTIEKCNLPIGGPGRFYGRCVDGEALRVATNFKSCMASPSLSRI
jgi:hypothetical protein